MDICKVCGTQFRRNYPKPGVRQQYCSRKCIWKDRWLEDKTCPTCGKVFTSVRHTVRPEWPRSLGYCSRSCIQRYPCMLCGKPILGRVRFQNKFRWFCSRSCASVSNKALKAATKYSVIGFAARLNTSGRIDCESCGIDEPAVLNVHHRDRDKSNNSPGNLAVLCANCHHREHWSSSSNRARSLKTARLVAPHIDILAQAKSSGVPLKHLLTPTAPGPQYDVETRRTAFPEAMKKAKRFPEAKGL